MINRLGTIFSSFVAIGSSINLSADSKLKQSSVNTISLNINPITFMPSVDMSTHSPGTAYPYLISLNASTTWVYDASCLQNTTGTNLSCSAPNTNTLVQYDVTKD